MKHTDPHLYVSNLWDCIPKEIFMTDSIQTPTEVPVETKPEEAFVSKKAYQEVTSDMMKYKEERKALKAELERLRADEQARNEAEQRSRGEYQKIADTYKQKFEESEAQRLSERKRVEDLHKLHHLEKAVGGFQRSEYAKIAADLNAIKLDDNGIVDEASLLAEATRIKQQHPALLKNDPKLKLPSDAPGQQQAPQDYSEALKNCKTQKELTDLMKKHGRL